MSLVIPRTATGTLGRATALVADAHAAGLAVHAFTFRDENAFLPTDLRRGGGGSDSLRGADGVRGPTRRSGSADAERGDGRAECVAFIRAGVDGLFADHPETAVAARGELRRSAGPRSTSATARPVRTSA
jgi:glycerophosphoryl diester phosphodiesterase